MLMYSFTGLAPDSYHCDLQTLAQCNDTEYGGFLPRSGGEAGESCSFRPARPDPDTGLCTMVGTRPEYN